MIIKNLNFNKTVASSIKFTMIAERFNRSTHLKSSSSVANILANATKYSI